MPQNADAFYLGIGSVLSESVTSKLSTNGDSYSTKLLRSSPKNWREIIKLLNSRHLTGALVKLTGKDYVRLCSDRYAEVADDFLAALATVDHLVLVHERVYGMPPDMPEEKGNDNDADSPWESGETDDWVDTTSWDEYWGDVDTDVREAVHAMLDKHGISVTTYKRNAELSVLASSFVDDLQSNLLFRIYVPAGRIFEDELAKVLAMFHEWLGTVKGQSVRKDGYQTSRGRVIEFFSETHSRGTGTLRADFDEFSEFLSLVDNPDAARQMLLTLGMPDERVEEVVTRYARDARRVLLDTKQERERRILSIRQQLESELSDEVSSPTAEELDALVNRLLPVSPFDTTRSLARLTSGEPPRREQPTVLIQQQIVHRAEGIVAQNIMGSVSHGIGADDVIRLIRAFGGDDAEDLETTAQELADSGAPAPVRLKARQKLKAFLQRNVSRIEVAAFGTAWKWVETQIGGG